jgi:ATP-dependent DNA helicase PIF1
VAALNVNGSTAHSFLRLPINTAVKDLRGESLAGLQERCQQLTYYIFDELSMIGATMLNAIDCRIRQAHPDNADVVFGNKSVILFGDFGQLPPVADRRMYHLGQNSPVRAQEGFTAYRTFTSCVNLTQCVRQQNDHVFKDCLLRIRDGQTSLEDYQLLSTRFKGVADNEEEFIDAVHLFPTREQANEHNIAELLRIKSHIATIHAVHNHPKARDATSNDAGGLERTLSIAVNAKIMLRSNLWVDAGLVNGSLGVIRNIIYISNGGPQLCWILSYVRLMTTRTRLYCIHQEECTYSTNKDNLDRRQQYTF